ncbi:MAG: hypothetical protein JWO53_1209, partial [Chlamydiia bacterium]|nr:hypothetical protein [Chlamydiia bacterium]
MVKMFLLCLLLATPADVIVEIPAKVSVEIPQNSVYENQPIQGTITIIRTLKQKVDEKSFKLDDAPLQVEFVDEVLPDSGKLFEKNDPESLTVSKYRFALPAKAKGLYVLNPISTEVGGVGVRSIPISFEVQSAVSSNKELKLEARVVESGPIYPGQRVT